MLELGFIPVIGKPIRVCKNNMTTIGNILSNFIFDKTLKKAIIKMIYNFPIIFIIQTEKIKANAKLLFIIKEILTRKTMRHSSSNISSPLAACKFSKRHK